MGRFRWHTGCWVHDANAAVIAASGEGLALRGRVRHNNKNVAAAEVHSAEDDASLRVHDANAAVTATSGEGLALRGRVRHIRKNVAAAEVHNAKDDASRRVHYANPAVTAGSGNFVLYGQQEVRN